MPAAPSSGRFTFAGTPRLVRGVRIGTQVTRRTNRYLHALPRGGNLTTRALLVDYGGVLTTSIAASFRAFCDEEDIDVAAFKAAIFDDANVAASPIARVETGAITQAEFDVEVAERLSRTIGRPVAATGLKERMFLRVRPDAAMRDLVARARRAGHPTVLVSNSWGGDDYPMADLEPLFDTIVISGEIGLRKPEPEIYLYAARAADRPPDACVFLDDLRQNIAGAEAVGMVGVLHRDAAETVPTVEELLGLQRGA